MPEEAGPLFGGVSWEVVKRGVRLIVIACPCGHVGAYVYTGLDWTGAECYGSRNFDTPHWLRRSDMMVVRREEVNS